MNKTTKLFWSLLCLPNVLAIKLHNNPTMFIQSH